MKITEKIFDVENKTETIIERDMTADEIAEYVALQESLRAELETQAQAQAKRSAALAKLEALGLDEDDLKALGL